LPTKENKMLFFKNLSKQLRIPFSIHYNFECLTVKMNEYKTNNSVKYQYHIQFGLYLVSDDSSFQFPLILYEGPDTFKLLKKLKRLEKRIYYKLKSVVPINLTEEEE
jgi:hypothetical protein